MKINILRLEATDFKGLRKFSSDFTEDVEITGFNGAGKSTLAEMISWNLFGTDTMGSTLDPTPIKGFEGNISVSLLVQVDDKKLLFERLIEKGKNKFYVNEVPKKSTEYQELIAELFTKEVFLSIFNPTFFTSQHWKEQRKQLLQYVKEPFNKEVLEIMPKAQAKVLEARLKKLSLTEIYKTHDDRFKKRDKEYDRLSTKVATLKEQIQKFTGSDAMSLDEVKVKLKKIEKEIQEIQDFNKGVMDARKAMEEGQKAEANVLSEIEKKKELVGFLMEQIHVSICETCGQELTDEAKQTLNEKNRKRLLSVKQEGKDLVQELAEVRNFNTSIEEPGEMKDLEKLEEQASRCRGILSNSNHLKSMIEETEGCEKEMETVKKERLESMKIVEAVKVFVEKKAEIQVTQVNDLFENLSVQLFEKQKNEELKQKFEIEWNGKPYSKLSNAEKIRAGLELIRVIQEQVGILAPTFVDNAESIIGLEPIPGQSFVAKVKNDELTITLHEGEAVK